MTQQASQIRAPYARMYALVVMVAAVAVAGTVWANSTRAPAPQSGIDVAAIMTTIDLNRLPVHTITDNF
jgi:hypothetical protein